MPSSCCGILHHAPHSSAGRAHPGAVCKGGSEAWGLWAVGTTEGNTNGSSPDHSCKQGLPWGRKWLATTLPPPLFTQLWTVHPPPFLGVQDPGLCSTTLPETSLTCCTLNSAFQAFWVIFHRRKVFRGVLGKGRPGGHLGEGQEGPGPKPPPSKITQVTQPVLS